MRRRVHALVMLGLAGCAGEPSRPDFGESYGPGGVRVPNSAEHVSSCNALYDAAAEELDRTAELRCTTDLDCILREYPCFDDRVVHIDGLPRLDELARAFAKERCSDACLISCFGDIPERDCHRNRCRVVYRAPETMTTRE